jgi:hypothetical protein
MTSIAYHILACKEPEQVARLVNRIQTDSDFIYIHFDTMIGKKRFQEWKNLIEEKCPNKNITIVSEFRCKYGSFGLVDSTLSAIKFYENVDYDYFIVLSGDSYPIKSLEILRNELTRRNSTFMEFFEIPYEGWFQGGLHRLKYSYYFLPKKKYPYVWTFRLPRIRKGLPCGLKPYGGYGSFCLQKRHASYLLQFAEKNPIVIKFFKRVWAPDEFFYQTILLNSPLKSSIINYSIMYVDFSEGTSHAKVLTKDDLESIRKSGRFFARKFSMDDGILDIIDEELKKY